MAESAIYIAQAFPQDISAERIYEADHAFCPVHGLVFQRFADASHACVNHDDVFVLFNRPSFVSLFSSIKMVSLAATDFLEISDRRFVILSMASR